MNHLGKLNHGNFQSIGLGALNNTINTEISGSVEAANTIIGDMAQQRRDMLVSLDNINNNLIGTRDEKTGERNFDGLIGRAYKNEAIALSKENQEKELTNQRMKLIDKMNEFNKEGKMFNDLIGAKADVKNRYQDDKTQALLGNDYKTEKESITRYFMANTGLDLETAIHSWNNGGRNSQTYQSLKAAGLDDNTINQVMSRANTLFNIEKEAKNIENGVIPKDILPRVTYETNKALLGRGYTQEQADRLTGVGIQSSLTNLYKASADAEAQANSIRLQPNYMDRDAIALQNQMEAQAQHNRTIEKQNWAKINALGNQQQQPIDEGQIDNTTQNNTTELAIVEMRRDGKSAVLTDKNRKQFILDDVSQLTALDENGNPIKLENGKVHSKGKFSVNSNVPLTPYNENGNKVIYEAATRNRASDLLNAHKNNANPEVILALEEELNKTLPKDYFAKNRNGEYILDKNGRKIFNYNELIKDYQNLMDEGFADKGMVRVSDALAHILRIRDPKTDILGIISNMGDTLDLGNFAVDKKHDTTKNLRGKNKVTMNQANGNTQLDRMQNKQQQDTELFKANQNKPISIDDVINPNSKGYFEIEQRAKNGDKEAISILQSRVNSETMLNATNKDVRSYINDDQKMIKDTGIDEEHLNQESKHKALTAISIMSVAIPQLRTDKALADKTIKTLYDYFQLQAKGKLDGNLSELLADYRDSLNVKALSNIGLNVSSVEDLGNLFSRDDIVKLISGSNIQKNLIQFLLYNK